MTASKSRLCWALQGASYCVNPWFTASQAPTCGCLLSEWRSILLQGCSFATHYKYSEEFQSSVLRYQPMRRCEEEEEEAARLMGARSPVDL